MNEKITTYNKRELIANYSENFLKLQSRVICIVVIDNKNIGIKIKYFKYNRDSFRNYINHIAIS